MNDPTCKLANNKRHTCYDKFGQRWDRGDIGPRDGTRCASAIAIDDFGITDADLRLANGSLSLARDLAASRAVAEDDRAARALATERDALLTEEAGTAALADVLADEADAFADHLAQERDERMAQLGDLFASVMPDPDDNDDCGMVLGE